MQLSAPPMLLRPFPKLWAYPVILDIEAEPVNYPGLRTLLLGHWDIRSPIWPVTFKYEAKPGRVVLPTLLVEETPPPGFQFTFCLFDRDTYPLPVM